MASSLFATRLLRLRNRRALAGARLARLGALTLLLSYLIIAVAAYNTAPLPTSLGLRIGNCGDVPCVAWVMPAGQAWQQGVRPGMMVLSIDGRTVMDSEAREVPSSAARIAELVGGAGGVLRVGLHDEPVMEGLARFSLWFLGGMFALLGAAVLLRRPDLSSARWFGAFSAAAAMALAVGPASAGSQPLWALVVQIVMLAGVGATCLPFIVALVASQRKSRLFGIPSLLIVVGIVILAGYAASVLFRPALYELVRPALFLYMAITMVGAIGLLALASVRQQSQIRVHQARIALFGIGLGTLPLITLTLVPEAFVEELLVPAHVSVLAVGLIPVAFAYAILQHNLLGIRRLVHRGMVYGLTTLATFAVIAAALSAATSLLPETVDNRVPLALTALLLTAGVALFMPLRHVVRWLVDKLLYDDVVQYEAFAEVVRGNLVTSGPANEVITGIARRLVEALRLESAVLFLGRDPSDLQIVTAEGPRTEDVLRDVYPRLQPTILAAEAQDLMDLRWERERVIHVDGTFEASSAPGAGTTVIARVPSDKRIPLGDRR